MHRSGKTGRPRLAPAGTLAAVLSLLLGAPGSASAGPSSPSAPAGPAAVPRGTAHMGMGVLGHDGRGGTPEGPRAVRTEGVDVSSHQGNVDWSSLWAAGVKWAYVKATEGTSYKNTFFVQQYNGAYDAGMIRGTYHFAVPDKSSGTAQADYFVDNGGGWSADGRTLPGVLDIEWNPYGAACYGKTPAAMVAWIQDFLTRYKARTGRAAVVYTATSWWTQCTGGHAGFGATNPLWIARYDSTPGPLPAGWSTYAMWQYTSSGPIVGDHNRFNGAYDRVQALARG